MPQVDATLVTVARSPPPRNACACALVQANKNKCPDVVSYLQADVSSGSRLHGSALRAPSACDNLSPLRRARAQCMTRAPSLDAELICFDIQSQLQADCIHWSSYYVLPGDVSYNPLMCKQVRASRAARTLPGP